VNQLKEYREQGYLHARGVFDAEELEELRGAIDRILESVAGTEHDRNHRWQAVAQEAVLKGFHDVQYHDAAFTRAAAQPRLVAILTELLGPNVQLHHTKMLVKPPAQGASFPMHQDYPYFPHERHSVVAASVHLDDTDLENGCLRVVPGSQGLGPLEATGPSRSLETPLEDGDVIELGSADRRCESEARLPRADIARIPVRWFRMAHAPRREQSRRHPRGRDGTR